MAEIVNLRRVKKARLRAAAAAQAAENRSRFGRTKADREADAKSRAQAARLLDGAHLGRDGAIEGRDDDR